MPGLSKDPAKRRRQLEALARGSEARAATLRARLAELDKEPPASAAPSEAAPSAAPSDAASAAGRVRDGRYSDAASEAPEPDPPAPEPEPDEPEPEPEPEPDPEPEAGRGLSIAAGLLGVKRKP